MLRAQKVVGKFVEFYGEGAASLPVPDRATIGNMAPEYGATMGFFPVDEESVNYLRATGRTDEQCAAFENYFRAQKMFGMPRKGEIDYSVDLELDLARRAAERRRTEAAAGSDQSAGARRAPFARFSQKPRQRRRLRQDRTAISGKRHLVNLNGTPPNEGEMVSTDKRDQGIEPGDERNKVEMVTNRPTPDSVAGNRSETWRYVSLTAKAGSATAACLIAAITSCTNTSNPSVMLAAGLLAKKAVERGLTVDPAVKTSLAPGSRVVTDYLHKTGLQTYLDQLGFNIVGYGCTTCIGNSGPLHPKIEEGDQRIRSRRRVGAFRQPQFRSARASKHQGELPDVAAAGRRVRARRPRRYRSVERADRQGQGRQGSFPARSLADACRRSATRCSPRSRRKFSAGSIATSPSRIRSGTRSRRAPATFISGTRRATYIHEPPFFTDFSMEPGTIEEIRGARPLGIFGDSVTTDHISPAGAIKATSPAGQYLMSRGVDARGFQQLRLAPRQRSAS